MPGMHGNYAAVAALQEADLLVALGARFDDRVTGNLATFAPKARIVHADIDPAEIGKNRVADVPIVGDVKLVTEELAAAYKAAVATEGAGDTEAWQRATRPVEAALPVPLRPAGRRAAQAPARGRAGVGPDRRRGGGGRRGRPAPDVRRPALPLRPAPVLDQLRRAGHDGLRRAGGHGGQGRPARRAGGRDRRRRLLPDDRPGAGHLHHRADPDQGPDPQQRPPGHGPPVAGAVLRRALLRGAPRLRVPGLREAGRGLRRARPALRPGRGRRRRPWRRRWPPTTSRWWWTSGSTPTKASSRWSRPAGPTTRSSSAPSSPPRSRRRPTRREVRSHALGAVGATREHPHHLGAGRGQAGGPGPHLRDVQPARLQHRQPGRRADRGPGPQPHDDRGRLRRAAPGAGHQAAQQAGPRAQDRRAGARHGRWSASWSWSRSRPTRRSATRSSSWPRCSGPRSSTSAPTPSPSRPPAARPRSRPCSSCSTPTASASWPAPAGSPWPAAARASADKPLRVAARPA